MLVFLRVSCLMNDNVTSMKTSLPSGLLLAFLRLGERTWTKRQPRSREGRTMDNEAVLLAAIHANPADETAWLCLTTSKSRATRARVLRLTRGLR